MCWQGFVGGGRRVIGDGSEGADKSGTQGEGLCKPRHHGRDTTRAMPLTCPVRAYKAPRLESGRFKLKLPQDHFGGVLSDFFSKRDRTAISTVTGKENSAAWGSTSKSAISIPHAISFS